MLNNIIMRCYRRELLDAKITYFLYGLFSGVALVTALLVIGIIF